MPQPSITHAANDLSTFMDSHYEVLTDEQLAALDAIFDSFIKRLESIGWTPEEICEAIQLPQS